MFGFVTVSDGKLFIFKVGLCMNVQTEHERTHRMVSLKLLVASMGDGTGTECSIRFVELISDNIKKVRFIITQFMKNS